jgi:catechol 2,3-dioxygenase-like lactoylglutathione lyase family enzyme
MNTSCESRIDPDTRPAAVDSTADVTLRVNNLILMKLFYQHALGFTLLGEFPSAALLQTGQGWGQPGQMLGLLERSSALEPTPDSIRQLAFAIPREKVETQRKRLQRLGLRVEIVNRQSTGRKSLCFLDPEGNEVELVGFDSLRDR